MADNKQLYAGNTGATFTTATDEVTYSGDTADVQLMRMVYVTGSEGSKTVVDLPGDATNGLDVDVTRVQGTVTISGTVTANAGTGTLAVSAASLPLPTGAATAAKQPALGTAGTASADVLTVQGITSMTPLKVDGSGVTQPVSGTFWQATQPVSLASLPSLAAGTNYAAKVRLTDGTNDQSIASNGGAFTSGCTAHDAVDAGNPMKIGAKALAHGAAPTAVAAGDRTDLYANRHGIPFAINGHPNAVTHGHTAITTAVTDTAMGPTVSAGQKLVLTRLTVTLDTASTVFPSVRIGFGTASVPALGNAGIVAAHGGLPGGGGMNIGDGSSIIGVGGDGEGLRITTVGNATGNGVQVTFTYFLIES